MSVCLASEIPSTQSNFCQGNVTLETERERERERMNKNWDQVEWRREKIKKNELEYCATRRSVTPGRKSEREREGILSSRLLAAAALPRTWRRINSTGLDFQIMIYIFVLNRSRRDATR